MHSHCFPLSFYLLVDYMADLGQDLYLVLPFIVSAIFMKMQSRWWPIPKFGISSQGTLRNVHYSPVEMTAFKNCQKYINILLGDQEVNGKGCKKYSCLTAEEETKASVLLQLSGLSLCLSKVPWSFFHGPHIALCRQLCCVLPS